MFTAAMRGAARAAVLGAAVVTAALIGGCVIVGPHLEEETRMLEVAHEQGAPIDVQTLNGHVDVEADGSVDKVMITAKLKARTLERLGQTRVVAARSERGALSVRAEWPEGRAMNGEGCSFEIKLPGARGVRIETSNGAVHVSGLAGAADLASSNGRITVSDQDGPVVAETSNGRVEVSRVAGDVRARSSNGGIVVAAATGRVEAATSNGSVKVALADAAAGPVRVRSSNGRVVLELGHSFKGRLRLGTSNGEVRMDEGAHAGVPVRVVSLKRRSAVLAVGPEEQAGEESVADTTNGDVEVRFVDRGSR